MQLNEDSLLQGDLKGLVSHIFEVDHFKSKMGDDQDVVVLSFTVESLHPAEDLVNFIEKGYQFVLDADSSPGELRNGKYKVFVELERNNKVSENIMDLLYGVGKLTNIDEFKFRYHKSFNSVPVNLDTLKETIPHSKVDYDNMIREKALESYDNFFSKSMLESIAVEDDIIKFKKIYAEPVTFKLIDSGETSKVLESIEDRIQVSNNDFAEVMFLTKYLGNYNITKHGNKFMLENRNYAILLEKI
jgi:hypothetical protein